MKSISSFLKHFPYVISPDTHDRPPMFHGGKHFPEEKLGSARGKQAAQGRAAVVLQNQWHQVQLQSERNPAKESGSHNEDETGEPSVSLSLSHLCAPWSKVNALSLCLGKVWPEESWGSGTLAAPPDRQMPPIAG